MQLLQQVWYGCSLVSSVRPQEDEDRRKRLRQEHKLGSQFSGYFVLEFFSSKTGHRKVLSTMRTKFNITPKSRRQRQPGKTPQQTQDKKNWTDNAILHGLSIESLVHLFCTVHVYSSTPFKSWGFGVANVLLEYE